jgi:hypothetical protein|tara:strand:- start:39 stop:515 length:477 start_codon:yes stop_codon:yes gene_type:complete
MTMKVSSETSVAMPMRNLISIVVAVGLGVWAYFGLIERLNQAETSIILIKADIVDEVARIDGNMDSLVEGDIANNTEFRIKWPRGDMGTLPADSEQYMLIEFLSGQVEDMVEEMAGMMNNSVNIKRLQLDIEKLLKDVETLKDKIRATNGYNGNKSEN